MITSFVGVDQTELIAINYGLGDIFVQVLSWIKIGVASALCKLVAVNVNFAWPGFAKALTR